MIEVINLSKSFQNNKAVNNISFDIGENEIIGLLGPNGCGKTTTIAMILGLLKPTKGKIIKKKKDIEYHRIELLHKMNFISPYIELPKKLTVKQNLIVYAKLYNVKNINERIDYLSSTLRLDKFINNLTGELSSGQKNRVSLAKSLINNPSVLLLDEPTASLDPETGNFIRSFLEDYIKQKKISILLASHNMEEVKRLCTSVMMMKKGKRKSKKITPSFIIKDSLRIMTALKFIKNTVQKNKRSTNFYKNLANEILASSSLKSQSIDQKTKLQTQILLNKRYLSKFKW